jgi:hypothetical protein
MGVFGDRGQVVVRAIPGVGRELRRRVARLRLDGPIIGSSCCLSFVSWVTACPTFSVGQLTPRAAQEKRVSSDESGQDA